MHAAMDCRVTAMALQWHCNGTAMALPLQCYVTAMNCRVTAMALQWQCHGTAIAVPCHCHGLPCHCHGTAMALQWHCHAQRLKKKGYVVLKFLSNVILTAYQCYTAVAEGAQLSTMRRGRAQPCLQRRARSHITSCQRHANALQRKKRNAEHDAQLYSFFFSV